MKIACPPGLQTDLPPFSAEPFWFFGENVRFREGIPETIGLYIKAYSLETGLPVIFPDVEPTATLYGDATLLILGHGDNLSVLRWDTGERIDIPTPQAGATGRWWFSTTEKEILCGRSNFSGLTYVIDRATLAVSVLPNAPMGGMGGGIVAGNFIKAGADGYLGGSPRMIVRWSARRTDPSSSGTPAGPFGFEDWVPSDVNSSGEFLLDEGSEIRGGGSTQMGFIVWTDTRTILLAPRNDLYVFTKSTVALRGLLSSHSWTESDGRIWWFDQTRTLNVFEGGSARQVMNPMRQVSTELIKDTDIALCFVSSDAENGEIILHYPDRDGFFREVVYNYMEDAWYAFALNRISMTDAHGDRPQVGIDATGQVYFYGIREALVPGIVQPQPLPPSGSRQIEIQGFHAPVPFKDPRVFKEASLPEPFSFFIMTNWISAENSPMESMRSRNVVMSHTMATIPDAPTPEDIIRLTVQSYGQMDLNETPIIDYDERQAGKMLRELRAGGKAVQYIISATDIRTHLRFSPLDVEADVSGKR